MTPLYSIETYCVVYHNEGDRNMDNPPLTQEDLNELERFTEDHQEEIYVMAVALS